MTPAGSITKFDADCQFCILTDIVQGPADILYITSNNPILLRFNVATGTFLAPIDIPNSNAVAGDLAAHGEDIWFTDFNNDSLWRYDIRRRIHPVPRRRSNRPTSPSTARDVCSPRRSTHRQPARPRDGRRRSFRSRTGSARGRSPSRPMGRSGSPPGSLHKASAASTRPPA